MALPLHDNDEGRCRFSDVEPGSGRRLPPIQGFEKKDLVSLEEAVKPLELLVEQVQHMVWSVKGNCTQPKDGLTQDESASIMLYTLEWMPPENSFYIILNKALRSEDRRQLIPWFLYLRLFIHALSKLQLSKPRIIYRGVQLDLSAHYFRGKEFVWWPFSSCTISGAVLEKHIGKTEKRTIFNILCHSAINISQHSWYKDEEEYLLYPGRQFIVNSICNPGNDLHIIELEETIPQYPFFNMPTNEPSKPPPNPADQFINILLIGEQGVGKSTFINAFANYLKFKAVREAQTNSLVVLKPLSFRLMIGDTFQEQIIQFGNINPNDPSTTQDCYKYSHDFDQNNEKKLCLIDTPSLKDDQNNIDNTIKNILDYVNTLTHLNGICFLLQPDASQISISFQSCFGQLMNRLGRNVNENIIFCFTNALTTYYTPGTTASLLRQMFSSLSMNDIPFSKTNTFFFENESFRYLLASQNGIDFNQEDENEYIRSWQESVDESKRLLDFIQRQKPYRIV